MLHLELQKRLRALCSTIKMILIAAIALSSVAPAVSTANGNVRKKNLPERENIWGTWSRYSNPENARSTWHLLPLHPLTTVDPAYESRNQ